MEGQKKKLDLYEKSLIKSHSPKMALLILKKTTAALQPLSIPFLAEITCYLSAITSNSTNRQTEFCNSSLSMVLRRLTRNMIPPSL